ncbi:MAG TPA: hypothetical protein EYP85_07625 [Armatimonadetes bacterium]|nr:hypothetical protein [Armatimonadota bacterium]
MDTSFLRALIEADNPLDAVWAELLRRWEPEEFPVDVARFYREREEATNRLERGLYQGFFELYNLLLEEAQRQDGGYVRRWLEGNNLVIVADSLSLREVGLLKKDWESRGVETVIEDYAVAPFPTLTDRLAEMLLGTGSPKAAATKDFAGFHYRYVAGPGQIPALPAEGPVLVWLRLPDRELGQVTVSQSTTVADAWARTEETLRAIREAAGGRETFITSDHGYLYADSPGHYWPLPSGVEQTVRSLFPRESRAQPLSKEGIGELRHYEAPERPLFAFGQVQVAIRGRHWWASESPNDRCTAHGGLSLLECLVPILRVKGG